MSTYKKILADATSRLGIKLDDSKQKAWGVYQGYTILLEITKDEKQQYVEYINFSMCASFSSAPVLQERTREIKFPDSVLCSATDYCFKVKCYAVKKHEHSVERLVETVRALVDYVIANGGVSCDEKGIEGTPEIWSVQGKHQFLCPESVESLNYNMNKASAAYKDTKENFVLGIIGALLGSVVGAALVILVARMGYISAISSAVMGFAVVFGYKKLGQKCSIFGGIICIVISIAMSYVAFRIDSTWDLFNAFKDAGWDMTFMECFKEVREWYEDLDSMDSYRHNLVLMVLAGAVGAVAAVWVEIKERKAEFDMHKLS